ncbi:MAG: MotA/TolQ/ExbB proton channel family protein, partial [Candidatus Eisenbacteria bacterium]
MKRLLWPLYFVGALVVAALIYQQFPAYIKEGGYLVIGLVYLMILVVTFVLERTVSLRRAQGRGSLSAFLTTVKRTIASGDVDAAIDVCKKQGGSAANVIRAGLDRFKSAKADGLAKDKVITETQQAIEEANGLERPLLERNLIALSTISSIATMVGLLGTVIGMIRSFAALGTSGAVDAAKLALGISEALVNTAGGLMVAIVGIVAYNVFTTKVDNFSYMIDEASFEAVQFLSTRA